ncbi:MAG: helix-turn-helix transcriptional regulator [Magnetospirillum sp.]|nr:helix-turn-helix transcriptional regulator [Magnetospirillum sp.]
MPNAKARRTTPVDHHVGARAREARLEHDMSQTDLAHACGITFQQIQKYESGANRVSASRLWQFAAVLGKPLSWFFEGLAAHKLSAAAVKAIEADRKGAISRDEGGKIDPETMKLARSIAGIKDEKLKKRLKTMLTTLSAG